MNELNFVVKTEMSPLLEKEYLMENLQFLRKAALRLSSVFIGTLCSVLVLTPSSNVSAQAAEGERSIVIEEIIVTARKIEESLQSAPMSITALTGVDLLEQNIGDLSDLTGSVPNLIFDNSSGTGGSDFYASVSMRGLAQVDDQIMGEPAVGIFIDGVYYARTAGGVMEVLDLERVEILRGPQGTLFGKNTMGGAINLISALPDENFGGNIEIGVGDFGRLDVGASVGGAVAESNKVFGKFSFMTRERDGYGTRIRDGLKLSDVDSTVARGVLRFLPSDSTEVTLTADLTRKREESAFKKVVAVNPDAGGLKLYNNFVVSKSPLVASDYRLGPAIITADPYTTDELGPSQNDLDSRGIALTITRQLRENLSLTSITSIRDMESAIRGDGDGTPLPYYGLSLFNEQDQYSQEFRFSGQSANGRVNWTAGAYLFHEDVSSFNPWRVYSGLYPALENLPFGIDLSGGAGFFVIGCPSGYTPPNCGNPTNGTFNQETDAYNAVDNDTWALFAQGIFQLTDRLDLTAGVRFSHDEKVFTVTSTSVNTGIAGLDGVRLTDDWEEATPMLSLKYQLRPDAVLYGSVSTGFKSGGWNLRTSNPAELRSFEPETVTAYEVGLKSEWLDQRLRLNAAVFYNDYEDLQLQYVIPLGYQALTVVGNVAKATVKGFEFELTAKPNPNFDLNLGIGYMDDEFKELDPELANDRNRVTQKAVISLDTQLPKAPEWTRNLGLKYTFPLEGGAELAVRGDYRYTSEYFHRFNNEALSAAGLRPALGLVSTYVAYTPANGQWELALSGTNLTDEMYSTGGTDAAVGGGLGISAINVGPPRMWTLTYRKNLGN